MMPNIPLISPPKSQGKRFCAIVYVALALFALSCMQWVNNSVSTTIQNKKHLTQPANYSISAIQDQKHWELGVVKLILMTRNEWPLLKYWVMYHGELIGYENLFIMNGSTDEKCIQFLEDVRDRFGVQVSSTNLNLNRLNNHLNEVANTFREN